MSRSAKSFEAEDPLALVPALSGTPMDTESRELMARTFVEEYMVLGFSDAEITELFQNPFYRATYNVFKTKGGSYVRELIKEIRNG